MRWSFLFVVTALFLLTSVQAKFARPSLIPVERLLANTRAALEAKPKDGQLHYTLARIHYLAFVNRSFEVAAFSGRGDRAPSVAPDFRLGDYLSMAQQQEARRRALKAAGVKEVRELKGDAQRDFYKALSQQQKELEKAKWLPKKASVKEASSHAEKAAAAFKQAIALAEPDRKDLYMLGLASLQEQYAEFVTEAKPELKVESLLLGKEGIKNAYLKVFETAVSADVGRERMPIAGVRSLVSHEAGRAFLRLAKQWPDEDDVVKIGKIEPALEKLRKLKRGRITPIVFGTAQTESLKELLAPDVTVGFDLDASGGAQSWPWLAPTTSLLVWDPAGRGEIRSGRQLFGSRTFDLFWDDGYAALALLDDDRDGWLRERELAGLAIWQDRNQDGISASNEVTPLTVQAIGVHPDGREEGHPMHSQGVIDSDGVTRTSWDWTISQ